MNSSHSCQHFTVIIKGISEIHVVATPQCMLVFSLFSSKFMEKFNISNSENQHLLFICVVIRLHMMHFYIFTEIQNLKEAAENADKELQKAQKVRLYVLNNVFPQSFSRQQCTNF